MVSSADKPLKFPKRFLWGASTSAHQIEGDNYNNWSVWELDNAKSLAKSASYTIGHFAIWPEIKRLASMPDNYVSGRAVDHYNRYGKDFNIIKKMNLNAFRFSIEWSRIEPEKNRWNAEQIDHYRQYIKALRERNIEPLITLYHWTMPVWFAEEGGFAKSANIKYFVRFAEKIIDEFGKDVRFITTINEPDTVAGMGYYTQEHPPGQHSLIKMILVFKNHLKAHKQVFDLARKKSRRLKVGFTKNYSHVRTADERWLSKMMAGLQVFATDTLAHWYVGRKQDFLGVNYYHTDTWSGLKLTPGVSPGENSNEPTNDLGWTMYPENLEYVLIRLKKYKRPIFVMETGVADQRDQYRRDWLNGTIRSINAALAAGVDVRGYMHWSLFDNFEWAFGRWPRFGLIGIDYENDLKRIPRKSAAYYAAFVKKARRL